MQMRVNAGVVAAALVLASVAYPRAAEASLTSSEKGLVKELCASSKRDDAQRVRSLVARTDLSPDESAAALTEALASVPFTDARGAFLTELVFGSASAPSRPVIVFATVKALLGRADVILQRFPGGLDHEAAAISELVAIYGWIDGVVANAGKPSGPAHDPSAGIPVATYDSCSKALRDHVDQNAHWLKGDGPIPAVTARLRGQAQATVVDLMPDGMTRRVEAADRLGYKGSRRKLLADYGVILADAGKLDDAAVAKVHQLFVRLPATQHDVGIVVLSHSSTSAGPPLRARGQVVHVAPGPEPYPFEGPAPSGYDPVTSGIAHDLAVVDAMRVLDNRWAQLRQQAERDTSPVGGDRSQLLGRPRGPSVEYVVGAAIHALLVDAPKAADSAVQRAAAGHPEALALLSDALGVLAAPPPDAPPGATAAKLDLGKPGGTATLTAVRAAPNGAVTGFQLDGHTWAIERAAPSFQIGTVRKDGQPVGGGANVPKASEKAEKTDKTEKPKKK